MAPTPPHSFPARIVDRLLDRRPAVRRAVLRTADLQRGVLPTTCVKSGDKTDFAMRVTATTGRHSSGSVIAIGQWATVALARMRRHPTYAVALPVAEHTWRRWQGRLRISVVVTSVGAAFLAVGLGRGIGALIAFGAILLVLGWINRVRAWHNAWVAVEYRPEPGEIVVARVHSAFDAEAQAIYRRSITRR
ncbi:MAG: hypothetical protein JWN62_648 [Acidimicrobiales bacterium]|nr:hypothetical protein [Acidimicrobiales bacterium]